MKLRAKIIAATRQQLVTMWASTFDGKSMPWRGVAQVCNERGPPGRTWRAQGPNGDKARPRRRPHSRATGTQVRTMAVVQGGQGGRQARLLACSRTLH
jgi:hypothetical protein